MIPHPLVLYYGDSGTGKTTNALYAAPDAVFIAAAGALAPAETICGYSIPESRIYPDVQTVQDVIGVIKKHKGCKIVVDDLSIILDQTILQYEKNPRVTKSGAEDNYAAYKKLKDDAIELRQEARYAKSIVLANAHLAEPRLALGRKRKGGVAFPGQSAKTFPSAFDLVLPIELRSRIAGWEAVCRVRQSDVDYTLIKDRLNCASDGAPANIAELLREYGLELPRIRELESKEVKALIAEGADMISEAFAAGSQPQVISALEEIRSAAEATVSDVRHQHWIIRDALDRGEIRWRKAQRKWALYFRPKKALALKKKG